MGLICPQLLIQNISLETKICLSSLRRVSRTDSFLKETLQCYRDLSDRIISTFSTALILSATFFANCATNTTLLSTKSVKLVPVPEHHTVSLTTWWWWSFLTLASSWKKKSDQLHTPSDWNQLKWSKFEGFWCKAPNEKTVSKTSAYNGG